MNKPSPWYVSAAAVRAFLALTGGGDDRFDDASDALIELAAETWSRYQADPARAPGVTRTGAYRYSTGTFRAPWSPDRPVRLSLIVSMEQRTEGAKPQLVDVVLRSEKGTGRSSEAKARHRTRRADRS